MTFFFPILLKFYFSLSASDRCAFVAFYRPVIRFGALSANGKMPHVPHAAIRLDLNKAFDVLTAVAAKFAFGPEAFFNNVFDAPDLFRGELASSLGRVHFCLEQNFLRGRTPDAVHIRQRDSNRFIIRNGDTCDTHKKYLKLTLSLIMFGILLADNINTRLAAHGSAIDTYLLY